MLRAILSRYVGRPAKQLRFEYSRYGKPALAAEPGQAEVHFNLSHSHGLALVAVTHRQAVGVDLEYIRPMDDYDDVARSTFSANEYAAIRALPAAQRLEAFYACWTRKEAYIKALGEGLSHPLKQFDVSVAPDAPAALLSAGGDPQEAARWSLWALSPGPGYVAALAIAGRGWQLGTWQFEPREFE